MIFYAALKTVLESKNYGVKKILRSVFFQFPLRFFLLCKIGRKLTHFTNSSVTHLKSHFYRKRLGK